MSRAWLTLLISLVPSFALAAGTGYSCDLRALTNEERSEHAELGRQMRSGMEQQRELASGYADWRAAGGMVTSSRRPRSPLSLRPG